MGFIDKGLRYLGKKIEKEDKAYIRVDCRECGEKDIKVHKMRARHGKAKCPKCGAYLVVMSEKELKDAIRWLQNKEKGGRTRQQIT